jgi:hypothetical protein
MWIGELNGSIGKFASRSVRTSDRTPRSSLSGASGSQLRNSIVRSTADAADVHHDGDEGDHSDSVSELDETSESSSKSDSAVTPLSLKATMRRVKQRRRRTVIIGMFSVMMMMVMMVVVTVHAHATRGPRTPPDRHADTDREPRNEHERQQEA